MKRHIVAARLQGRVLARRLVRGVKWRFCTLSGLQLCAGHDNGRGTTTELYILLLWLEYARYRSCNRLDFNQMWAKIA
jgi:hypothetical protein